MGITLVTLICAFLAALPLLLRKKFAAGIILGVVGFLVIGLLLYSYTPSTAWPLFGLPGFLVFLFWIAAAIIDKIDEGDVTIIAAVPVVTLIIYILSFVLGSGLFRASDYASMLGSVEERVWTQDVQPKDEKHMRMRTTENANYSAKKILGEAGAIGSQFPISESHMTLQMIKGELWYVVPLDYDGFSVWTSTDGVLGYIMVHGEDPHRQPVFVKLEQPMKYTPGAFFGNYLERHIRSEGYTNYALTDYTFEIDENGKPWWVVTAYEPTIMWDGEKVSGVILVDPVNGETTFKSVSGIPNWVDRAIPSRFIGRYIDWNGKFQSGWLNSWWGRKNLVESETPILIYAADGRPEWVTGVTSTNEKDDSLIGIVYTDSRSGKSVRYKISGGATDTAIIEAVNKNTDVQFRKLHGTDPQIYNVYGTIASVVPLLNDNHAFQGVAIVPINDTQRIAVGNDQYEAMRIYEKIMNQSGQQIVLGKERDLKNIEGVVDRYSQELVNNSTVYYLHISNMPHIFTGGSAELSVKLPLTNVGDKVKIEYYASGRDVVPMHKFDNLSLPLSETPDQQNVRARAENRKTAEENIQDAKTVMEKIKGLSPEELKKLGEKM